MAQNQLLQTLTDLNDKISELLEAQKSLQEKVKNLEKQKNVLEAQHQEDIEKLRQAEKDIEFLSMSYKLADNPDTLISTRKTIIGLIRTINNCIRMLKEE